MNENFDYSDLSPANGYGDPAMKARMDRIKKQSEKWLNKVVDETPATVQPPQQSDEDEIKALLAAEAAASSQQPQQSQQSQQSQQPCTVFDPIPPDVSLVANVPPSDALPRRDLTDKAFRKYELVIHRSLTEPSFILCTVLPPYNVSPRTFGTRFKDAILAYRRYNYKTHYASISQSAMFHAVRTYPVSSSHVRIVNNSILLSASNPATINALSATTQMPEIIELAGRLASRDPSVKDVDHLVRFSTPAEELAVRALSCMDENADYVRPGLDVLIRRYPGSHDLLILKV